MIVVQLSSVEEFIGELQSAKAERIVDQTVRLRISRAPEQKERVTFSVSLWITAILRGEEADYLLEFGQALGSSDSKTSATEIKADGMESKLKDACAMLGLKVRPGKIEVF